MPEPTVIQKAYDLVKWYVPLIEKLPRNTKFTLGDRITNRLYNLLDNLVAARYAQSKLDLLHRANQDTNIIRYQTRLLLDFQLISVKRYEHASKLIEEIGVELGGWLKSQQQKQK